MIINNTYFKGELYLAHAKPGITDGVTEVEGAVNEFINDYSREVLFKSLGSKLFYNFESQLDETNANGLIAGSDSKWDDLLNGKTYTNPDGELVVWRGIRYKSRSTGDYDRSFITNYVYFFFQSDNFITTSNAGNQIEMVKNAETVVPANKTIKAWNKFIDLVQGEKDRPEITLKKYGLAVDYWVGEEEICLYKFIKDSNKLVEDTYEGFKAKSWVRISKSLY
tara:strand:+ start:6896 stop:7564 length:669 start_codon:yes stop_codon:yes gene_type:complete